MTQCRPLADADADIICRFPRTATELFWMFPKARWPFTAAQLLEAARQRVDPTVLDVAGQPVAYCNFVTCIPGDTAILGNVIVDPQRRGQGYARRLVEAMQRRAFTDHGVAELRLSCFADNQSALLLYHRTGFSPIGWEVRESPLGERVALLHFRQLATECVI